MELVPPETCARCSRIIGPKQTACFWHSEIVCRRCLKTLLRLEKESKDAVRRSTAFKEQGFDDIPAPLPTLHYCARCSDGRGMKQIVGQKDGATVCYRCLLREHWRNISESISPEADAAFAGSRGDGGMMFPNEPATPRQLQYLKSLDPRANVPAGITMQQASEMIQCALDKGLFTSRSRHRNDPPSLPQLELLRDIDPRLREAISAQRLRELYDSDYIRLMSDPGLKMPHTKGQAAEMIDRAFHGLAIEASANDPATPRQLECLESLDPKAEVPAGITIEQADEMIDCARRKRHFYVSTDPPSWGLLKLLRKIDPRLSAAISEERLRLLYFTDYLRLMSDPGLKMPRTKGQAHQMIQSAFEGLDIEASPNDPATQRQLEFLKASHPRAKVPPGITKQQAHEFINSRLRPSTGPPSLRQLELLRDIEPRFREAISAQRLRELYFSDFRRLMSDPGLKMPYTKGQAAQMIDRAFRECEAEVARWEREGRGITEK